MSLLEVEGVEAGYGPVTVVPRVSFTVGRGRGRRHPRRQRRRQDDDAARDLRHRAREAAAYASTASS